MNNVIFIGNGLNRTIKDEYSWETLMNEISKEYNVLFDKNNSFPLEFEKMINVILKKDPDKRINIYNSVKKFISDKILKMTLEKDSIHYRLLEIKCNNIITTNYDFLLEKAYIGETIDLKNIKPYEDKYLMRKLPIKTDINFYHIHGVATKVSSICLGYEHYAGLLENLRSNINKKEQNIKSKMIIKQKLFNEIKWDNHWYEFFYNSNIYILGFNMDLSEIDIWWLLTHRAYLYYNNYEGLKEKINNEIVFFDIYKDTDLQKIRIHNLLEGLHVKVKAYKIGKNETYLSKYNLIIDEIKQMTEDSNNGDK